MRIIFGVVERMAGIIILAGLLVGVALPFGIQTTGSYIVSGLLICGSLVAFLWPDYEPQYVEFQPPQEQLPQGQGELLEWANQVSSAMMKRQTEKFSRTPTVEPATVQRVKPKITNATPEQHEAKCISQTFRNLGFTCRVELQSSIHKTPQSIMYRIVERPVVDRVALDGKAETIARAIAKHRKASDVRVQVLETQPLYLQVNRPDPQPHAWGNRPKKLKPMQTCIGDRWLGGKQEPIILDFAGEDCTIPNGLFCGQPRSGKSRNVQIALLGLLQSTTAKRLQFWALDMNTVAWKQYVGVPHFQGHYSEKADIVAVLEKFAGWCSAEGAPKDGVYRLLIFDEFQLAIENEEIGAKVSALMKAIMSAGAKYRIRVWIVTQIPDKACYPPRFKALTHFVIAHEMAKDGYIKQQFGLYGSNRLQSKRECILQADGVQKLVTCYYLPDAELKAAITGKNSSRIPVEFQWKKSVATPVIGDTTQPQNSTQEQSSGILPVTGGNLVEFLPVTGGISTGISVENQPATSVQGVYMYKFPLASVRMLTDSEITDAIAQLRADPEPYMFRGQFTANKVSGFLFGKGNNETKRIAGEVIRRIGE